MEAFDEGAVEARARDEILEGERVPSAAEDAFEAGSVGGDDRPDGGE